MGPASVRRLGGRDTMTSFDLGMAGASGPADRVGHWGPQILIGSILATIALVIRPLPYDSPAATLLPVCLFVLVIGSWLLMRHHDRRLCERCLSSMPLNAAEVAARHHRRLAVTHLGSDRRLVIGYLAVLIGSNVLLAEATVLPGRLGAYLWAAIQATMIYLVLSYSTHRRLQPWCARCNGRGGGEREDSDAPQPQPSGSAPS